MCKVGFCAVFGMCFPEMNNVKAKVVPVNEKHPHFPGAQGRVKVGLAFSGGGSRAMSVALGVLRALEGMSLMGTVDAISSVSGGSWASAVYMFANQTADALLGSLTNPSGLTMTALNMPPPALEAVTRDTGPIVADLWWKGYPHRHLWVYTIGEAILKPFGLDRKDCYMASNKHAVERIKAANPQLKDSCFQVPAPDRPPTVIMSGSLLAPTGYQAEAGNVVSLQMSPDYSGSPFYPDQKTVTYFSESQRKNPTLPNSVVGGGLVESFAFGGGEPHKELSPVGSVVEVVAPYQPLSVAKAMGVSSAGPASALTQFGPHGMINLATLNPVSDYWGVVAGEIAHSHHQPRTHALHQQAGTYGLGDGGNIDNSGVLALLQRRATHIVWLISSGVPLPEMEEVCELEELSVNTANAMDSQITGNFGYIEKNTVGQYLAKNQVFDRKELAPLLCELAQRAKAGKPAVVLKKMDVLRNNWWGIEGGSTAKVLFFYNALCEDFVKALPNETREEVRRTQGGPFERFPNYRVALQNLNQATALSAAQTSLLAAHAEYMTVHSREAFRDVLAGASG